MTVLLKHEHTIMTVLLKHEHTLMTVLKHEHTLLTVLLTSPLQRASFYVCSHYIWLRTMIYNCVRLSVTNNLSTTFSFLSQWTMIRKFKIRQINRSDQTLELLLVTFRPNIKPLCLEIRYHQWTLINYRRFIILTETSCEWRYWSSVDIEKVLVVAPHMTILYRRSLHEYF